MSEKSGGILAYVNSSITSRELNCGGSLYLSVQTIPFEGFKSRCIVIETAAECVTGKKNLVLKSKRETLSKYSKVW